MPTVWLTPRRNTINGTREPSQSILRAVILGNAQRVKELLAVAPSTSTFSWAWEPYCTLTSSEQLDALQLVVDDSRFEFNAEFVVLGFYFTTRGLQSLILRHPRSAQWRRDPNLLADAYEACIRHAGWTMNPGMQHRRDIAISCIWHWKTVHRNKVWAAAVLYTRLTAFAQEHVARLERDAQDRFEQRQRAPIQREL